MMVVPKNAGKSRSAVGDLRSLHEGKDLKFHTFHYPGKLVYACSWKT